MNIVPGWDIERCELLSVRRYPGEGQYSPMSLLLYSYKYFLPFAVVCNLKKMGFCSVRVRFCTSVWQFFAWRQDVRRHLKQRHATTTCEGIRVSVPISSKCSDIEWYRHTCSSALILIFGQTGWDWGLGKQCRFRSDSLHCVQSQNLRLEVLIVGWPRVSELNAIFLQQLQMSKWCLKQNFILRPQMNKINDMG